MKNFTLQQIINACGGEYNGDKNLLNTCVSSIVTDSRNVREYSLFVAIQGEKVDGHSFIDLSYDHGAVCVLCEKYPTGENAQKPYIYVNSTLQAVKNIAKAYRELFDIPFIGVTGSVGKTSTKEMIAAVLSQKFNVHKTKGNFNNELGVPLTIFDLENEHEISVIEMGISDFGEMSRLSAIVRPNYCVITNIGFCHLEGLVDRDGVLKAKTEMFEYMQKGGKIFLSGDDDKLRTITEVNGLKPIFYGFNNNNDYYAQNVVNNAEDGIDCTLCFGNEKINVTIPAIGNHMVANALAAVAVGKELKITNQQIVRGITQYRTVGSRSNIIKTKKYTIIDDCYNANPTSVKSSIDMLKNFDGRHVCILGDMKELGENEIELHRDVGEYAAKNVDLIICIGELSKETANGANSYSSKSVYFETAEKAMGELKKLLENEDVILVKASRSMKFETIVEFLKN